MCTPSTATILKLAATTAECMVRWGTDVDNKREV